MDLYDTEPTPLMTDVSPSGKYKLEVLSYRTGKNTWAVTRGVVTNASGDLIAQVDRNYSSFPFLWMEGHGKGDFLICGADYQGQTVIRLDSSGRRDQRSVHADEGHGFCWSSYRLMESNVLLVLGCVWACPYEYKLFDMSDPMKGWPEIPLLDNGNPDSLDEDELTSCTIEDGFVRWEKRIAVFIETEETEQEVQEKCSRLYDPAFKLRAQGLPVPQHVVDEQEAATSAHDLKYGDWEETPERWRLEPYHSKSYRRTEAGFELTTEYKSFRKNDSDRAWIEYRAEIKAKHDAWELQYKEWLQLLGGTRHFVYPSQMQRYAGETNPAFIEVTVGQNSITWGTDSGEIKVYKQGTSTLLASFPRTDEGVLAAKEWCETLNEKGSYEDHT